MLVFGLLILGLVVVLLAMSQRRAKEKGLPGQPPNDAPVAVEQAVKFAPAAFDIADPAIGNPRERMRVLGWNQVTVLRHAASGRRVFHSEPGRSNSEDGKGNFFYQPRTVDSLVNAGFLVAAQGGGFVMTPLGLKALHTLPERSN